VQSSCRRREHRRQVDAPDTLPAEPQQKQQGNWRQALRKGRGNLSGGPKDSFFERSNSNHRTMLVSPGLHGLL
jgi:hypothetical protein